MNYDFEMHCLKRLLFVRQMEINNVEMSHGLFPFIYFFYTVREFNGIRVLLFLYMCLAGLLPNYISLDIDKIIGTLALRIKIFGF